MINSRAVQLAAVLALAFASNSMADLIGSSYTFSSSGSNSTTVIGGASATDTDPSNPVICVGFAPVSCSVPTTGTSVSFAFANIGTEEDSITFTFTGTSSFDGGTGAGGSFTEDLASILTLDGSLIVNAAYASGSIANGSFSLPSFDTTDLNFLGASDVNGQYGPGTVVFDVTLAPAPEPGSIFLSGLGIAGLALIVAKRHVRA
jgi:hypothetical protein